MLNRLVEPSTGEIRVNNELAITFDPVQWRRKIGYVIQKAGLLPHMTVRENITLLARILKRDKKEMIERSDELLNMIGLDPSIFAQRYPKELSGASGLGDPIFRGVATVNGDLIFLGAVPSALLAIMVDKFWGFVENKVISPGLRL